MNLKQQLISFMLLGVKYRDCWRYLLKYLTLYNDEEQLTLQTVVELFQYILPENTYRFGVSDISLHEEEAIRLSKHAMMLGEQDYPIHWSELPQPPLIIFYKGNKSLLLQPAVSIVGTRKITPYGKKMTREIVTALVQRNIRCVSGLALGVDTEVHQTACKFAHNTTIAVVPCGLDFYYPCQNKPLQDELMRHHLVVSEYLPLKRPQKHQFIMRNRLVAGLTAVTIMIEGAYRSGSLITANYALQYNREVYAVPGRITDIYSAGCNDLIRAGATPITCIENTVEDIVEFLQLQQPK